MQQVECKTLRLDKNSAQDKGQAIVNKLDSLGRNTGGLFGTSLLLSARRVENAIFNRCKSLGIPLLQSEQIKTLRNKLIYWKENGHIL